MNSTNHFDLLSDLQSSCYNFDMRPSKLPILRARYGPHGLPKGRPHRSEGCENDQYTHPVTLRVLLASVLLTERRRQRDSLQV